MRDQFSKLSILPPSRRDRPIERLTTFYSFFPPSPREPLLPSCIRVAKRLSVCSSIVSLSSNDAFINLETHNSSYCTPQIYSFMIIVRSFANNILYFVMRIIIRVKITGSTVVQLIKWPSFREKKKPHLSNWTKRWISSSIDRFNIGTSYRIFSFACERCT